MLLLSQGSFAQQPLAQMAQNPVSQDGAWQTTHQTTHQTPWHTVPIDPRGHADDVLRAKVIVTGPVPGCGGPGCGALALDLPEGWKIYWRTPGAGGAPPRLDWSPSHGVGAVRTAWPPPQTYRLAGLDMAGYGGMVRLPLVLAGPITREGAAAGAVLAGDLLIYVCKEICLPVPVSVTLPLDGQFFGRVPDAGTMTDAQKIDQEIDQGAAQVTASFAALANQGEGGGLTLREVAWAGKRQLQISGQSETPLGMLDLFIEGVTNPAQMRTDPPEITLTPDRRDFTAMIPLARSDPAILVTVVDRDATTGAVRAWEIRRTITGGGLIGVLLAALLGGLILNLTPCGLPILALKLTVRPAARSIALSLVGVFTVLAVVFTGVQSLIGPGFWGSQFQQPLFVAALLGMMVMLIGVAMGWIAVPGADFLPGTVAGLLAGACLAPYTVVALGASLAAGPWVTGLVVLMIGVGLALPYGLAALSPRLAALLVPRPGRWTLFITVTLFISLAGLTGWLVWVYEGLVGIVPTGLVLLVFAGVLLIWRAGTAPARLFSRGAWLALPLVLLVTALWPRPSPSQDFTLAQLDGLVADEAPVLVVVGARWCLTCTWNEALLAEDEIQQALTNVQTLYLDWTVPQAGIEALLRRHGQAGIPFTALYRPEGVTILSPILTKAEVLAALGMIEPVS
ncbi:MAG: protein-disulfide reductase DsbD domain-containing protein [Pseudomonadota bacterium]